MCSPDQSTSTGDTRQKNASKEIRAQKRVLSDDVRRQVTEFRDRISEAPSNILETIWQDTTCPDANILSALPPINPKDTLHSRDSSTHPSVSQAESSNIKNHCCKVLGPIVGREEIIVSNDIVPESESSRPAYGDQSSVTELEGYHSDLVVDTFTKVEKLLADGSGKVGNTV